MQILSNSGTFKRGSWRYSSKESSAAQLHRLSNNDGTFVTATSKDSMTSIFLRHTDSALAEAYSKLNAIPDVISALQNASTIGGPNVNQPAEKEIVTALTMASNLARGNAEVRSHLRDTSACKLITSILHSNTNSEIISQYALQSLCLLIRDNQVSSESLTDTIDTFSTPEICGDILLILKSYSKNATMTVGCFIAICSIAVTESNRTLLSSLDACEDIMESMLTHYESSEVITIGLQSILCLTTDHNNNRMKFIKSGLCQLLISMCNNHMTDVFLIEPVVWTVLHLSATSDVAIKSSLGEGGLCDTMVDVMDSYLAHLGISQVGCQIISNLSNNHDMNKAKFRNNGACELIILILDNYPTVPTVTYQVMGAVTSLCTRNVTFKTAFGELGMCEKVLESLAEFENDAPVAASCCRAAASLAGIDANKFKFENIFVTLIQLMREFPGEAVVAESVCLVLSFLHSILIDPLQVEAICHGIMEIIARRMDHPSVLDHIIRAVVNLSGNVPHALALGDSGVCEQVTEVVRRHKDVPSLMLHALKAVTNLCLASDDNCGRFSDSLLPRELVACLHTHITRGPVVELGCRLLVMWLLNHENMFAQDLSACGASHLAIEILNSSLGLKNTIVCELACQILSASAQDLNNSAAIIESGGLETLTVTLRVHSGHVHVVEYVCWTIACLASHSEADRVKIGEAGACELLVETLNIHQERAVVAEQVCCAIRNLCHVEPNIDIFGTSNCCETLTNVLRIHSRHEAVAIQCAAAIAALSFNNPENIARFGASGVCEVLLEALRLTQLQRDSDLTLLDHIVLALVNLSVNRDNAKRLIDARVCEEIIEATKPRIDIVPVAERTMKVLLNLAIISQDSVQILGYGGACEFVMEALLLHQTEENMASLSLKTIIALAGEHEGNAAKFVNEDICGVLVNCMKLYLERNRLSYLVCRVITAVTTNDSRRSRFGRAGACEAVMDVTRRHLAHGRIIDECCRVIYSLVTENEANASRMELAGVDQLLNRILVKFSENSLVSRQCLQAIEAVCINRKICQNLTSVGVCELVIIVLDRHSLDIDLSEQVLKTVVAMISSHGSTATRFSNAHIETALVDLLLKHGASDSFVVHAINLTIVITSKNLLSLNKFINAGMCEQLSDLLHGYYNNIEVVKVLFNLIPIMIADDASMDKAIYGGICEAVVRAVKHNIDHPEVADRSIKVMSTLCKWSPDATTKFISLGVCEVLVEILRRYVTAEAIDDEGVAFFGIICGLFTTLSDTNPLSRAAFGAAGVTGAVMDLLTKVTESLDLTTLCLRVAASVCAENEENAQDFGNAGICDFLSKDLQHFLNDSEFCETWCLLVLNLTHVKENLSRLISLGITESLINAIQTHIQNALVTELAFKCIALIPIEEDPYLRQEGFLATRQVAMETMEIHVASADPIIQALRVLRHVLIVEANQVTTSTDIEKNALNLPELLITVGGRHHTVAVLLQNLICIIGFLCSSKPLKKRWSALGFCDLVTDALNVHVTSIDVCETVLGTITPFCSVKSITEKFLQLGLCEHVIDSAKAHIPSEILIERALEAIQALITSHHAKDFINKFGSLGIAELLQSILKQHIKRDKIVTAVFKVIYGLCTSNDSNRNKAGILCDDVVIVMKKHYKNAAVVVQGCCAVAALAASDANRARLGAPACEQIVEAMTRHSDEVSIAEFSCLAATKLATKNDDNKAVMHNAGINQSILRVINKHKNEKNVKERGAEAMQMFVEG